MIKKKFFLVIMVLALTFGGIAVSAQTGQGQGTPKNDKNGDGICDITGQPVKQGQAKRKGNGPNGSGNKSGNCNGTGQPQGRAHRGGR